MPYIGIENFNYMKISEMFRLDKSQAELDFIDIDTDEDIRLFLDPFFLSRRTDNWSSDATLTLRNFFQTVIDLIRDENIEQARELFYFLGEPNSTCLGMSTGNPQGRGVGNGDAEKIFQNLVESRAIETGLIQDIEDSILFVDKFGKDKLSDMTTNIIAKHLIEYTQNQCNLLGIPLRPNTATMHYWDANDASWVSRHTEMLVIGNKRILLVPKGIVSFSKAYTPERYYNHFVLDFLQNENLQMQSALVKERRNGVRYVTKKSISERHPISKDFLRWFSAQHPEVLEEFKNETEVHPLSDNEFTELNVARIAQNLATRLSTLPTGNDDATNFHKLILGALEIIFYPDLINPKKEREIHEGRKRIDITFDNAATDGIFHRLAATHNIISPYIFVECKNYSRDVANPEIDQIAGRFSHNRGRFGIIICRSIENRGLLVQRCKDTFLDGRGLIVPLVDSDIIALLNNYNAHDRTNIETFFSDRVREILF